MNELVKNLSIVIPAYNEGAAIGNVVSSLKASMPDAEIVVVDDGSGDRTADIARESSADIVIRHKRNKGYGASIKSGVRAAGRAWIATFDADGQHRVESLQALIDGADGYDMVIGARSSRNQRSIRLVGKKLLFSVARYLAGEKIPDLNSGLRLFRKELFLSYLHLLPDTFSLSTTITMAMLKDGRDLNYVPIETNMRDSGTSRVSFFRDGYRTFVLLLRMIILFDPLKVFHPISLFCIAIGLLYGVTWVILHDDIPDGAGLFLISGILIFLFGLMSDQISELRRRR